jgi:hypothetical protein
MSITYLFIVCVLRLAALHRDWLSCRVAASRNAYLSRCRQQLHTPLLFRLQVAPVSLIDNGSGRFQAYSQPLLLVQVPIAQRVHQGCMEQAEVLREHVGS